MDSQLIDERVRKGYELYLKNKDEDLNRSALRTLNQFHKLIDNWQGNPDNLGALGFYRKYLTGQKMNEIAARGSSTANVENFHHIMTRLRSGKKVAALFCLRKDHLHDDDIGNLITQVGLVDYVVDHPLVKGARPLLYSNRFLVAIFIDIMTALVDQKKLEETAEILGINDPRGIEFPKLQILVRKIIEESLIRQNLGIELTKFTRAGLAFHIHGAFTENNILV